MSERRGQELAPGAVTPPRLAAPPAPPADWVGLRPDADWYTIALDFYAERMAADGWLSSSPAADLRVDLDHWKARAETAEADLTSDGHSARRCGIAGPQCPGCLVDLHRAERQRAEEAAGVWAMELETLRDLEQAARAAVAEILELTGGNRNSPWIRDKANALIAAVDALPAEETPTNGGGG